MDSFHVYRKFSEEDPEAFKEGFMDFSEKIVELYQQTVGGKPASNPYEAGYEYAVGLALQPITATLIETVKQHMSEAEKQARIRSHLEDIFNI